MSKKPSPYRPFSALETLKAPRSKPKTFADAMKTEGTEPLGEGVRRVPPARTSKPRVASTAPPAFSVAREEEWVEGYRAGLAASVRRRLGGVPAATLDLHRHDSDTARRRVVRFLALEREKGRELVLVIVGRGRHSPGGRAVLRDEIAEWLTTPPTSGSVLAFRTAPRELGGSGAVLVLLKGAGTGD
jgi:DNA-nicking Smr family endonuclease